jgi:cytochrome c-type biogenesis protein CcmH
MAAAAAAERRDFAGAIVLMKRLKGIVAPNSEESQQVDQMLAELEAQRKGGSAAAAAPASQAAAPKSEATSPTASGASVTGRVDIDPKLAGKFAPGDALFIYARDPEGSRMPLAIVRGTAAELPKAFTLTDAMAMTPAATISKAKSVVIEARISKSGNAAPSAGDLRGTSAPIQPGAGNVRVVIDQVVP